MLIFKFKKEAKNRIIPASEMKIGETGIIIDDSSRKGNVLLRAYDRFVNLSHNDTWSGINCFMEVKLQDFEITPVE